MPVQKPTTPIQLTSKGNHTAALVAQSTLHDLQAIQDAQSENVTLAWHQTALCTFLSGNCHPIKT